MIRAAFGMMLGIVLGITVAVGTTPTFHVDLLTPSPDPRPTYDVPDVIILTGKATHYDAERKGQSTWYTRAGIEFYGAAGPRLRALIPHEWRNEYRVIVTSQRTGRAVLVHVVDFCECRGGDKDTSNDRLIDLAPAVWDALGVPLKYGVTKVTLEVLSTP